MISALWCNAILYTSNLFDTSRGSRYSTFNHRDAVSHVTLCTSSIASCHKIDCGFQYKGIMGVNERKERSKRFDATPLNSMTPDGDGVCRASCRPERFESRRVEVQLNRRSDHLALWGVLLWKRQI